MPEANTTTNTAALRAPTLARVVFEGADAASFLQGQLSADTAALPNGKWTRAAYCSRQGRVLASVVLCRAGDDCYVAAVREDIADDLIARLSRFVLRAKVNMRRDDGDVVFAFGDDGGFENGGGELIVYDSSDVGGDDWQQWEIARGVPWVGKATQEMFLPQFINLDLLGGVDFKKGCYVGQEVVARLHYRGSVKRRAMVVAGDGKPPEEGAKITDGGGVNAGEVVNAAANGGGFTALAAVILAKEGDGLVCDGKALTVSRPAYLI